MGLIAQIKVDVEAILSNVDDFAVPMLFTAKTGETALITGIHTDHSMAFNQSGESVSGKTAPLSVAEKLLTDLDYPTRNSSGLVDMIGHKVRVTYADSREVTYIIDNQLPDYSINLLTFFLSEYGN